MSDYKEIDRLEDVPVPSGGYAQTAICRGCGRKIELFYNGGELDHQDCCGFLYSLEAPQIDFVTYEILGGNDG